MQSLALRFILTSISGTTASPNDFPFPPLGSTSPSPTLGFIPSLRRVEEGERCIDGSSCPSGVQGEGGAAIPFWSFPSRVHLSVRSSECVGVSSRGPAPGRALQRPL